MKELTPEELAAIGLPKWPALVVIGDSVTKEDAMEIIIRTTEFYFMSNDKEWLRLLNDAAGIRVRDYYGLIFEDVHVALEKYGVINIEYLKNDMIASSWIGGPHGWCSWDGRIFSNHYNVGKWPHTADILDEWLRIAKAFPQLNLRSQLCDGETCETPKPVIEYHISQGRAMAFKPEAMLVSINSNVDIESHILNPFSERGCSIDTFKEALTLTERRIAERKEVKT